MSFGRKNPPCSPHRPFQPQRETNGLEVPQVSDVLEEACLSSHPPNPGVLKEAPDAGIPSTPNGPPRFHCSSTSTALTSSSKSDEGSSSQEEEGGTSEAGPYPKGGCKDPVEKRVDFLVNFLLFKFQMKEPITKADMLKIIGQEFEDHFVEIFQRASHCLEIVFGLDVKEVDHTNHCYATLIKMGLTYDGLHHGEKGIPKTGILILVLCVIAIKGSSATEEEVWKVLSVMRLYSGKRHYILGEPRQLITKHFVEEEYLKYQQVVNSDPPQFEFLWGPRAHAETTKMEVLEFLAKVKGIYRKLFPIAARGGLET